MCPSLRAIHVNTTRYNCKLRTFPFICRKQNEKPPEDPEMWQFVVDYHCLYAQTKFPVHSMLYTEELPNVKNTFMINLDLTSGYFQIPIRNSDILKTAFIVPLGLYIL